MRFIIATDNKRRIKFIRSAGYKLLSLKPEEKLYGKNKKTIDDDCEYFKDNDVDEKDLPFLDDAMISEFSLLGNKAFILTKNKRNEYSEYVSEVKDFAMFVNMTDFIRYILLYGNLRKARPNEYIDTFNEYNRYIEL